MQHGSQNKVTEYIVNNKMVIDPVAIANSFNDYFIDGSFHLKSPKKSAKLNGSDPDFDESAYIWSL